MRVVGVAAVALFIIGMLGSFPFIYGDPAPGTTKQTPGWFLSVGYACTALLIVGVTLLLAPGIHMRRKHHR